ncbi:mitochondrial protein translocase family [Nannochloropsis gaditana]|uniref:Mitochondrial protein translocase family n=1 Tax=Nannochloropsis gaditana TaxID=72520 RepID=W7TJX5_9STRA|nr:mitochondrial protein translocase family [Nannochloropsis gaditana]
MSWFGFGGKKEDTQESSYDFSSSASGFEESGGGVGAYDSSLGGGGMGVTTMHSIVNSNEVLLEILGGIIFLLKDVECLRTTNVRLGAGGGGQLEELVMAEQQKALVQSVIARLTEMAFETCITKPASSLSSGEQSCIQATVAKYLDTSEFVLGRVQRSAQRGQGGGMQ